MATIASLNIIFRGQVAPLNAAVGSARKMLGGFQKSIFSLNGALAGIGAGLSLNALKNSIGSAMESIDRVAKVSDRIGITTEALLGLQHAAGLAGVETAMLDQSLTKMGNFIAEAFNGGKAQTETLDRLGLKAKELASLPLDQAFLKIADGIMALDSPALRVSAAMDVFGKSGAELIPLLQQGGKGIADTAAEVDELGASFSRVDAAQVEAANDALDRVGTVLGGIKNQVAIALAPAIEFVAKKFVEWGTTGEGVGSKILFVIEGVAMGIGKLADVVSTVNIGFQYLQAGVTAAISSIVTTLGKFGTALNVIIKVATGVDTNLGGFLQSISDDIKKASAAEWEEAKAALAKPPPSENIKKFFDNIRSKSRAAAEDVAKAAEKINDIKPADSGFLSGLQSQFQMMKTIGKAVATEIGEAMTKAGQDLTEDMLTPLEQFEKRAIELQALLDAGKITKQTFARAKNKELLSLADTLPDHNKRAGAIEFGSREDFSARLNTPAAKTEKEILDEVRMQTKIQQQLLTQGAKSGEVVYSIP